MKTIPGRDPLRWLVVNPDGKLLCILDSQVEAVFYMRNRGHATDASVIGAPIDYAQAPELLAALEACAAMLAFMPLEYVHKDRHTPIKYSPDGALAQARAAIAKATGR